MKKVFIILACVIISICFLYSSSAMAQFSFFDIFQKNSLIGKPAPDFTLSMINNGSANMTEYRDGKSAIVFFWMIRCPHCQTSLQTLNSEYKDIERQNIKLILVNLGDAENEVDYYVKRTKILPDIFLDGEATLAEPYHIVGVPTFVFIDKNGVVKDVKHKLPINYAEIVLGN